MAAQRPIAREGRRTRLPVRHPKASDEEMGTPIGREHVEREARRAKNVIVTEPARWDGKIVTARKGVAFFKK